MGRRKIIDLEDSKKLNSESTVEKPGSIPTYGTKKSPKPEELVV